MADIAVPTITYPIASTTTRQAVHVVRSLEQFTANAATDITAGAPVRFDANGKFVPAQADTAANARVYGVAVETVRSGFAVTAIRRGIVDYDTRLDAVPFVPGSIYLSNTAGTLSDTPGTTSVVIGTVVPGASHRRGGGAPADQPAHLLNVAL